MRTKTNFNLSELRTVKQASDESGVALRTVYNFLERGLIKSIVFGSRQLLDTRTVAKLPTLRRGFVK